MNIEAVADFFFELRYDNKRHDALPAELEPSTMTEAYEVQTVLVTKLLAVLGGERIGYKIGCTSVAAQKLLNTTEPVFGQLLSSLHWQSPAELKAADFSMIVIEPEFAFQMAADVPTGHYDATTILPYIKSVMPSIEVVHHHLADWSKFNAPITAADNAIHGGWIQAEANNNWQSFDYPNHEVLLFVDGQLETKGRGDRALGNPLNVLAWLANSLSEQGLHLKQNDYVTTGVCMDVYTARAGQEIMADFGTLGRVSLKLS